MPAFLNMYAKNPMKFSVPMNINDNNVIIKAGINATNADFLILIGQFVAEIAIFAPNDPRYAMTVRRIGRAKYITVCPIDLSRVKTYNVSPPTIRPRHMDTKSRTIVCMILIVFRNF